MNNDDTLYLVDGSSYIYRAYFAIRHLSAPDGTPTNAIYGFIQMLLKLLREHEPKHVAVVFDAGRVTFRTEIYPEYKANRASMPDELRAQIKPIREVVRAFNIPVLEMEGYEADDIIAALAGRFSDSGGRVVVVTGDKDMMQIVSDRVTLLDTMKGTTTGVKEVIERFGVRPELVPDILGLAGDSSDNIPGVPGIGEKTACRLIAGFGSLDRLIEKADEVKGKAGEKLREFTRQALLSRKLATVERAIDIDAEPARLAAHPPDIQALNSFFRRYGFSSLVKELTAVATLSPENYHTISAEREFEALLASLESAGVFALDLETTSLDPRMAAIVGISFSFRDHEAFYIPVGHVAATPSTSNGEDDFTLSPPPSGEGAKMDEKRSESEKTQNLPLLPGQLPRDIVLERLRPLLESRSFAKVGQNIKFDMEVLSRNGIALDGAVFDTMIASYLLNPVRKGHGLDALAQEHLNHRMISYSDVTGAGKEQKNFSMVEIEAASRYACEDSDATWLLKRKFEPMLAANGLTSLFENVEMPLVPVLAGMEDHGVLLDSGILMHLSSEFGERLSTLQERIFELAGLSFNLNSPKQTGEVLFERLGLQSGKKNRGKTGWSTDNEVLGALAEEHEIARQILEHRRVAKLKSTYSDALPRLLNPRTGRVHTSYNQCVTSTGRLSSSEPNLQNIPIRSEDGRKIRGAFIAPPGHFILSADYSQIELRVLAHLSKDPLFMEAFEKDEDIHTRTAVEVFGIFPEMVTTEMRRQAKAVNFGIIYGQGAFSLAKQLGLSRKTAEDFIRIYRERHKGGVDFLDGCIRQAEETGFVTTLMGRRIPVPEIKSSNANVRGFAQRNAINYPIQGSAADIIKCAMLRVCDRIGDDSMKSRLIMQVHDELVFEIPEDELLQMERMVEEEMEKAAVLDIPLKVEINYGKNWSEAH